jgi:hypothetical protein
MQIWLTVLAEGFSLGGWLCFLLSKFCFVSHKSARKASNPKVSQRAMRLNDKLKDEREKSSLKLMLSCERLGLRVKTKA